MMRSKITALPEGEITSTTIQLAYKRWQSYQSDYKKLADAYAGDWPDGQSVSVNLCKYASDTKTAFLTGIRPEYVNADETDTAAQQITDLYSAQSMPLEEQKLVRTLSIYGRAYELVYLDDDGTPKCSAFTPRDAFVAYDPSVDGDSVFGAVHYAIHQDDGTDKHILQLYTQTDVISYEQYQDGDAYGWKPISDPVPHGFGRVPLIEYSNSDVAMGDYEAALPVQYAYNRLLTDRQIDKDAFAAATLVVKGFVVGQTDDEQTDALARLKEKRVIQMPDNSMDISYLTKTYDEAGVQILQDQYRTSFFTTVQIPDLTDESFGTASGVAIQYKLLGLRNLTQGTVAQMLKGYRRRCKLYAAALHVTPDYAAMTMRYRLNIPTDLSYESQALSTLVSAGIISVMTARRSCSLVEDADRETEQIAAEQEAADLRTKATYEDYDTGKADKTDSGEDDGRDD